MYSKGFVFLVNAVCFLSCRNSKMKTSQGLWERVEGLKVVALI